LQQQPSSSQPPVKVEKATAGFILSLIAGLLVLVHGILWILRGEMNILGIDEIRRRILVGLIRQHVGVVAIVFAVLILVGAVLVYLPGKETIGGVLVLVFSVLSILTGGGFLVGFILGIVGGVLALIKK
jgi:hypothetical protein